MAEPALQKGPFPGDEKPSGTQQEGPDPLPPSTESSDPGGATTPPEKPSDAVRDLETHHGVKTKALLRKIDAKLLPAVGILYLLSFLDRSNGIYQSHPSEISSWLQLLMLCSWQCPH